MMFVLPAGELDRQITLERITYTDDGFGKQPSWSPLATVSAKRRPMRGNEVFDMQARTASVPIVFTIRWSGEAILPLSLAKQHLRVDWAEEDELILVLRDAAIDMVEQYCNIRLGPVAGLVAAFGAFEPKLRLGVGPAFSIVINSVSYVNAGTETTLDPSAYRLAPGGVLMPASRSCWPTADGDVTVTFDAGYPVNQAPPALIHAARLFLGHLYLNREAVITEGVSGELSLGFMDLCNRYRVPVI